MVVVAALYGQFLNNPIFFDDVYFLMLGKDGAQPIDTYRFEWLQPRSFPYATLAWTKDWFGLSLINFRLGNLFIHLAVCIALLGFLSSLFGIVLEVSGSNSSVDPTKGKLSPNSLALICAILFALHPVATYAVGYLVQRTMLFSTLFSLLAMFSWIRSDKDNKPQLGWMAVPFYYLAAFSKEHAIMLIAIFPTLTAVIYADWRHRLRRKIPTLLAMFVIAIIVAHYRKGFIGSVYEVNADEMLLPASEDRSYILSVMTQMSLFFKYGLLWLAPVPGSMSIDMRESFADLSISRYWIGAIAFLAWGGIGYRLIFKRNRIALLGFAMVYPWLMFMTELSTVRIQEIFVLYRSYLWVVGVLCALPLLLERLAVRTAIVVSIIVSAFLFMLSMERLATMSHPLLLWEDARKVLAGRDNLPGASRIYYNLGTEYIQVGDPKRAIPELKSAIAVAPHFAEAYGNLGAAYVKLESWDLAASAFDEATNIELSRGKTPSAKHLLGGALSFEKIGNAAKSQLSYSELCRIYQHSCDKVH